MTIAQPQQTGDTLHSELQQTGAAKPRETDDVQRRDLFARLLLPWYRTSHRDLPWRRRAGDAYAVWISEIMLQQTTVAAVIPFYERWMERFPTVEHLADADIEDVLRHWAGLGYYARARNLHKAAQMVVERHGGALPRSAEGLRALPGIGRYTAGAVASIAYNLREPLVDANVARVLSRVFGFTEDMRSSAAAQERLWTLAADLVPEGDASYFNQAMMELGALVCSAAAPRCEHCPLQSLCFAFASGEPTAYPESLGAKRWLDIDDAAVAVTDRRGRLLIVQRPLSAPLWGGLWELPRVTRQADETIDEAAQRAIGSAGISGVPLSPFGQVKHVVANRRVTLHGFRGHIENVVETGASAAWIGDALGKGASVAWIEPAQAADFPMATPQTKLIALWNQDNGQGRLEI
jgi:A/G-specific adenine glycosylase